MVESNKNEIPEMNLNRKYDTKGPTVQQNLSDAQKEMQKTKKELDKVKGGEEIINFKVNNFPKINVGCKCYLVHDGFIRGWMEVVGLSEKEFTCSTTGKKWVGKFIERSGPFHNIDPILMKGFQGFRYY